MAIEIAPKVKISGWYQNHPRVSFRNEQINPVTGEITYPPSMTKQEFKDQCNINKIIKEFTITGQISHISAKAAQGAFLDLPADLDYQTSLNVMIRAEEAFMALPAAIRDRFGHDPAQFLGFVADPANADELIRLGIRTPPAPPAPGGDGGTPPSSTPTPQPAPAPGGSGTAT